MLCPDRILDIYINEYLQQTVTEKMFISSLKWTNERFCIKDVLFFSPMMSNEHFLCHSCCLLLVINCLADTLIQSNLPIKYT